MGVNWRSFAVALAVMIVVTAISLYLFPLSVKTAKWDYSTHSYITTTNYTAFILIGIATVIICYWLSSYPFTERTRILRPEAILRHNACQETLARFDVTHPINFMHTHYVGEFTIGHLLLVSILNQYHKLVYMILLGNENYATTELKTPFDSPIIACSYALHDIRSATRILTPKEKGTEEQLTKLMKQLERQGKGYQREILARAEERAEGEMEEELE